MLLKTDSNVQYFLLKNQTLKKANITKNEVKAIQTNIFLTEFYNTS